MELSITISPTSSLVSQEYMLSVIHQGAFTNLGGDVSYVGTAYTFKTILQNIHCGHGELMSHWSIRTK